MSDPSTQASRRQPPPTERPSNTSTKTLHDLYGDVAVWNRDAWPVNVATVRRVMSEEGAATINRKGDLDKLTRFLQGRGYVVTSVEERPYRPRVRVRIQAPKRFNSHQRRNR